MGLGWIPIQTPLSSSLGQFYRVGPAANPRDISRVLLLTKYMNGWLQIWCHHQRRVSQGDWNSLGSYLQLGKFPFYPLYLLFCCMWHPGDVSSVLTSQMWNPRFKKVKHVWNPSRSRKHWESMPPSINLLIYSSLKTHVKAVPMTNSMFSNLKPLPYAWKKMKAGPHELRPHLLKVIWASCLYSSQMRKGSTIMESGTQSKPLPGWCKPWLVVYPCDLSY